MKSKSGRRGRRALVRFAAVLGALLALAVASAGAAQACSYSGGKQAFAKWRDSRDYVLAPDGGFEAGGSGWGLARGAAVVGGNESFFLNGAADSHSLAVPTGGEAISPAICVNLATPVFRLVARNEGDPSAALRVEARYMLLGLLRTTVLSTFRGGGEWAPSPAMSPLLGLSTIVGTLIPSSINIRITSPDSGGKWQVDDLYIDPFARH
jgi:hypothetical protein